MAWKRLIQSFKKRFVTYEILKTGRLKLKRNGMVGFSDQNFSVDNWEWLCLGWAARASSDCLVPPCVGLPWVSECSWPWASSRWLGLPPRGHPAEGRLFFFSRLPTMQCVPPSPEAQTLFWGKSAWPSTRRSQPRRSMDAASPQCGLSLLSH